MINENGWIPEAGIIGNKELKEKLFVFTINHPTFLGITCSAISLSISMIIFIVAVCKHSNALNSNPPFTYFISMVIFIGCLVSGAFVEGVLTYKRREYYGLN